MWKSRPDDKPATENTSPQPTPASTPTPVPAIKDTRTAEPPPRRNDSFRAEVGHIGKSVMIKGELSGSEDLYFDGEAEGSVDLHEHTLTIGPNGRIRATIVAREIIVHGKVEGNVHASEKVELKKSCMLTGDISTQRIVIEDGAFFKGAIDIQKDGKPELRKAATSSTSTSSVTALVANSPQGSFLEDK
jgi:cytoskeletal protein CcmA (bactofilin family)